MSVFGVFRAHFPRLTLTLPGESGPFAVEFVVDTGFDGALALLPNLIRQLGLAPSGYRTLALAEGTELISPYYEVAIKWEDEPRLTDVVMLDGRPLLGVELPADMLLTAEMYEGGEIRVESL